MRPILFSLVVALTLAGCRDEQAGPKPRGAAAPAPQNAPQPGQVRTVDAVPGALTHTSGATWAGGAVTYLGSILEPAKPMPGQSVTLKHYFRADKPIQGPWRFFLHVMDESSRQQIGNLDHELQNGAAPLGTWPVGKIIEDVHGFQMPNLQAPIRLYLGFWNDQGRLPIDTVALSDNDGRVLGPKIENGQAAQPLPEYVIVRAAKPPVIDGKIDEAEWAGSNEHVLTRSMDGAPVARRTTFRMKWDDTNLYVAFRAEDPDIWGTLLKKDDPIYNEECVEVFLDADANGATYNELQVSPHNTNFDASFVARRSDLAEAMKWESGMKTAVFIKGTLDDKSDTDEYWTAEMQIPIASLNAVPHPPQKGDRWRFNAYRLEQRPTPEGQSFSPLFVGDFHALPRFGWLVFE
jgi:Carbohydrate family 9 binding domain-like